MAPATFLSAALRVTQAALDAVVEDYVAAHDETVDPKEFEWHEATPNGSLPTIAALTHRDQTLLRLRLTEETAEIEVSWTRVRH